MNLLGNVVDYRLNLLRHVLEQLQRRLKAVLDLLIPHPQLRSLDTGSEKRTLIGLNVGDSLILHRCEDFIDGLDPATEAIFLVLAARQLRVDGELAKDGEPVVLREKGVSVDGVKGRRDHPP